MKINERRLKSENGLTLLELLAALVITAPALIALTGLLQRSGQGLLAIRKEAQSTHLLFHAQSVIEKIIEDSDTHRFFLLPRVHKHGRIQFSDGSLNPISMTRTSSRPSAAADSVMGVALDTQGTMKVQSIKPSGTGVIIRACSRLASASGQQVHSLIAVTVDGLVEVVSQKTTFTLSSPCSTLKLFPSKSMLTKTSTITDLLLSQYLIPITKLYTLYIDRRENLRYLAHSGSRNIENQPIVGGVNALHLRASVIKPQRILRIEAHLQVLKRRTLDFEKVGSFSRTAHFNFVLNRP